MSFAGPVFISYNHADREFAGWLAEQLLSHRVAVWYDEWEMRVGDSLRRKVQDGIDTSAYLIIVLSPDSVNSEWVSQELDGALVKELESKRVFVLPVLHKDCAIPLFLKSKLYADFRNDSEEGLEKVLASIDRTEIPGHSREQDPSTFTDWTTDWTSEDGFFNTKIIINQHSKVDDWSIICTIEGHPNDNLNLRFQEYIDNDLEWYAKGFALNSIADTITREEGNTDIIYIDGALETRNEFGWGDLKRDLLMNISVNARRLGIFINMDTVFEYGSLVKHIVDEHNDRQQKVMPSSEAKKLNEFLIKFPIDEPYRLKSVGRSGELWVPSSRPGSGA